MKKSVLVMMLVTLSVIAVGGCGSNSEPERIELNIEKTVEPEQSTEMVEESTVQELTFAELSKWQFGFSSGAGGWGEEFVIEKDGYFWGKYQESFDYYNQLISETSTTMDWVIYTGRLYELSDECLNYLWNLIRYNVEEERYQEILAEQRAWIAEKEKAAEEARDAWEGGSFAQVDYNDTLATMTIERCQVLAGYLE